MIKKKKAEQEPQQEQEQVAEPVPADRMVRARNVTRRDITEDGHLCKPGEYIVIRQKRLAQFPQDILKPE